MKAGTYEKITEERHHLFNKIINNQKRKFKNNRKKCKI